jgi:hypothetical protein
LDGAIITPARNALLQPSVVQVDEKFLIFVSEDDQKSVTRDDVKEVFLKILHVSRQANVNSLGTTPFGQPHLPESAKGIVNAIRDFEGNCPREISIFEVDPTKDRQIFSSIEAKME